MTARGPMFLSDTALIWSIGRWLAKIAIMTAKTARMFGVDPVIAMVSFQILVLLVVQRHRVREAVAYLHEHPWFVIDGEIQADFALNPEMLKVSVKLAGKKWIL
jgi:malate dehydrogenase (oxaloacetate-decarboxylating)(NADP+)